jgi:hypothetical protein
MEVNTIETLAALLTATGPFGVVGILSWAYWRLSERKDRELRNLYDRLIRLAETQTAAVVKLDAALVSIKDIVARCPQNGSRPPERRTP